MQRAWWKELFSTYGLNPLLVDIPMSIGTEQKQGGGIYRPAYLPSNEWIQTPLGGIKPPIPVPNMMGRQGSVAGFDEATAIHELAHALWWEPSTQFDASTRAAFIKAAQRLARETNPKYAEPRRLAQMYLHGGDEWPGAYIKENEAELYAYLAGNSLGDMNTLPDYISPFYSSLFSSAQRLPAPTATPVPTERRPTMPSLSTQQQIEEIILDYIQNEDVLPEDADAARKDLMRYADAAERGDVEATMALRELGIEVGATAGGGGAQTAAGRAAQPTTGGGGDWRTQIPVFGGAFEPGGLFSGNAFAPGGLFGPSAATTTAGAATAPMLPPGTTATGVTSDPQRIWKARLADLVASQAGVTGYETNTGLQNAIAFIKQLLISGYTDAEITRDYNQKFGIGAEGEKAAAGGNLSQNLRDLQWAFSEGRISEEEYGQEVRRLTLGGGTGGGGMTAYQAAQLEQQRFENALAAARTAQPLSYMAAIRGVVPGAGGTDLYQGIRPVVPTLGAGLTAPTMGAAPYREQSVSPNFLPMAPGIPGLSIDSSGAPADLIAYIKRYFPPDQWANALAVSKGESGWNPTAWNQQGESSQGYFQINKLAHPNAGDMLNPEANVAYAADLYNRQGWQPWTVARNMGLASGTGGSTWEAPAQPKFMSTLQSGGRLGAALVPPGTIRIPGPQQQSEMTPYETGAYEETANFQGIPSMDWQNWQAKSRQAVGGGLRLASYGGRLR